MTSHKNSFALPGLLLAAGLLTGLPLAAQAAPADDVGVDEATGTPVSQQAPASSAAPESAGPSLQMGGGVAVNPIYQGSSRYAAFPSLALRGVLPTDFGTFTASFPEGLRWDLPGASSLGLALLAGYDPGRKEKISTLGGNNHHLRGMGDLDGTPLVGAEAYWRMPAGRLFVRALQSTRNRDYGGDDLGRTSYLEGGFATVMPLSPVLTFNAALFGTWSDDHDMMARFGVTRQQAARSGFDEYHAGGGMRDVTLKTGATVQMSPHVSLEGGVKLYTLVAGARHSPLTDETMGAGAYLNALYRF